jgi:diguanylate cyclase (GGDEF)-like protein
VKASRNQLAALVRLGLVVALTISIVVPVGYFMLGYAEVRYGLSFTANLTANRLAKYIYTHRELWQYQAVTLTELLKVPEADDSHTRLRVFDAAGALVTETGDAPDFLVVATSVPIVVAGSALGRIEASASLEKALLQTGFVALFSGLLGFAVFFVLRLLPTRVLDKTIGKLESQTLRFEVALDNMSRGLCMFDAERRLLVVNKRYPELFGIPPEKIVLGMAEAALQALSTGAPSGSGTDTAGEWTSHEGGLTSRTNGVAIASYRRSMADGGVVVTYEDVTERRLQEEKIFHLARHDSLTELPNRRLFHEALEVALKNRDVADTVGVHYLGIDNFKNVNDTLGLPVGDKLLQQIASRLRGVVRGIDSLARVGGDEFAIIQTRMARPFDATDLAVRVLAAIGEPYVVDGQQIEVGASIGIALAPPDGNDADLVLKNADLAFHLAKTEARGSYRYFEADMDAHVKQRHTMEMELRRAIAMEEFELFYQPIINIASEKIVGFEALLRWNHPERGLVPPNDFIPTAEQTGQIVAIGEWVIRTACFEAATWPSGLTVAVNLSPIQIRNAHLETVIREALAASRLPAGRLELEITETVMLHDDEKTMHMLFELHDLGVRFSMDDFGAGYSSLSVLRKYPFDRVKIDQSFISDMSDRGDSLAVIRAVSAIGVSLGMATTAEGVETLEQFALVKQEGCTEAQGYLFSRPKPAGEVPALLAENSRGINFQARGTPAALNAVKSEFLEKTCSPPTDFASMPSAWPDYVDFEAALLTGDRGAAAGIMERSLAQGHSIIETELHMIQPALYQIGEKWKRNQVSVVQEHLATAIAQAVMVQGMVKCKKAEPNGKKLLLACVEGNYHALGLQMVADAFELAGWEVNCIGANVPTASLVVHVGRWKPDLLGLSVSFQHQHRVVKEIIVRLNESLGAGRPRVIIGGLATNESHDLTDWIGADAWSPDAAAAVVSGNRIVPAKAEPAPLG